MTIVFFFVFTLSGSAFEIAEISHNPSNRSARDSQVAFVLLSKGYLSDFLGSTFEGLNSEFLISGWKLRASRPRVCPYIKEVHRLFN